MREGLKRESLVVGGGPAGVAAAVQLVRAGRPACLLERRCGPHHKVCGEFISGEAEQLLDNLGVSMPATGAQAVTRLRMIHENQVLETGLPFTAWSLSRRRLDETLLQAAESEGVEVRRGVTVRDMAWGPAGWRLRLKSHPACESLVPDTGFADTIFLANGKHDLRGWQRAAGWRSQQVGLKMHLRVPPQRLDPLRGAVEVYWFAGGYAGLELVEEDAVNLCCLIDRDMYRRCERQAGWLSGLIGAAPALCQRLCGARPLWSRPLAIAGVPYGYLHSTAHSVPNLFRVGDQAAVISSFAGDGIAMALHSGQLAGRLHAAGGDSREYHRQVLQDLSGPVQRASGLDWLLSRTTGRKLAFASAHLWPGLIAATVRSTRVRC